MPTAQTRDDAFHALRTPCSAPAVLSTGELRFAPIRGDAEIAAVLASDREAYGEEALTEPRLREWLAGYPDGAVIAWQGNRVVGSLGVWPLTEKAYHGLIDGSVHENDIGPELFPQVSAAKPCAHWTVAAIYVHPDFRGGRLLPEMLSRSFSRLANSGHAGTPVNIMGQAFSDGGARTLTKLGLTPAGPSRANMPPYEMKLDEAGLAAMPERIADAFAHRQNQSIPAVSSTGELDV